MAKISFLRGDHDKYSNTQMSDGIYFAPNTNSILMNGDEFGCYPKDFSFPSSGTEIEVQTLCQDFSPNKQRFEVTASQVDFDNGEYLNIEIDISNSSRSEGICALAIGGDITGWKENILWVFYNQNRTYQGNTNLMVQKTNSSAVGYYIAQDTITLQLKKDGLYLKTNPNAELRKITTLSSSDLSFIHDLDTIHIGSNRADSDETLSDATYNKISVNKIVDTSNVTMAYKTNKIKKETVELPMASSSQSGMMSYEDKMALDHILTTVDGGTF